MTKPALSGTDDEVMAYHESGHAVAALVLGVPITSMTLSEVRVKPSAFDLSDPRDIERDAMFTLAGEIAEGYVHEDTGHTSCDDRKHFEELCLDRYPEDEGSRARWKLEMDRKTNDLVHSHLSSIELLAAYLLEERSLSRAQVVKRLKWPTASTKHLMVSDDDL